MYKRLFGEHKAHWTLDLKLKLVGVELDERIRAATFSEWFFCRAEKSLVVLGTLSGTTSNDFVRKFKKFCLCFKFYFTYKLQKIGSSFKSNLIWKKTLPIPVFFFLFSSRQPLESTSWLFQCDLRNHEPEKILWMFVSIILSCYCYNLIYNWYLL